MKKTRKICCEITPRRIIGAVLVAATVVNLIIVGAAFEASEPAAAPTFTETGVISTEEKSLFPATVTGTNTTPPQFLPVTGPTETASSTSTVTATSTATETATLTATSTNTPSPSPTLCTKMYSWPVYVVKGGDTLSAIGRATGTSLQELIQANCLTATLIYPGQELHVRYLPIDTPTHTATTPPDTPTEFKLAEVMECDTPSYVSLAVFAYDPQIVLSVDVRFYAKGGTFIGQIAMQPDGDVFSASGFFSQQYTIYDIDYYSFVASDGVQNSTVSQPYRDRSESCIQVPSPQGSHDDNREAN